MPIYEYKCADCKKQFERIQKLRDPDVSACPFCGGSVHKCFSVPALQFKGKGFYKTDYKGSKATSEGSKTAKVVAPPKGGKKV